MTWLIRLIHNQIDLKEKLSKIMRDRERQRHGEGVSSTSSLIKIVLKQNSKINLSNKNITVSFKYKMAIM